ncbi:MAG: hypothetical protein GX098_09395 [Bacteroidales bacterium]|nr:hypothetical protein [Bacteroidales bacterium]
MKRLPFYFLILTFLLGFFPLLAQEENWPEPPEFKSYLNVPGKVLKYNYFNYIEIRDPEEDNYRQAMGTYWEISYSYDSAFRQKRKFKEFMADEVLSRGGTFFFEDTSQLQFVIPDPEGHIWGRQMLTNDKNYRLRVIKEKPFTNRVAFDQPPVAVFDRYLDSVALPPRINYFPGSVITRIAYSKFNHVSYNWTSGDTLFRQTVMGPTWDMRLETRMKDGVIDRSLSTIEVMESYYRSCRKVGGTIIKNRPRELIMRIPHVDGDLWCRVSPSLDGMYVLRVTLQAKADYTAPELRLSIPVQAADSTGT